MFKLLWRSALYLLLLNSLALTVFADEAGATDSQKDDSKNNEHIVISAYRDPFLTETPESITALHLELSDADANISSVLDILDTTPGVFANGQGGMFQTYSIRGSAKNRIRTLVEGIPIVTERRAGVSSSFIDPLMFQSIDIMRGPVSTFYGSGALGGAINFFLPNEASSRLSIGAQDQGQGIYSRYLYATEGLNLAISHRDVGETETADGDELNNGFSSSNLFLRKTWQQEALSYDFFWLQTDANDIGKSNARFNVSRNTIYPSETHSLVKFQAKHDSGWLASVFYHPNDLTTDNDNLGGNLIRSENASDDFGATFQKESEVLNSLAENIDAQWGLDWFARRDVEAYEIEFERGTQNRTRSEIIENGSLDDIAFFASALINVDNSQWHLGGRYNTQRSKVANSASVDDEALTAFVGLSQSLNDAWQLQINVASGFRFPTISERFFSGNTARGETIAPASLDKEESLNLDLALLWQSGATELQFNTFVMDVDNYIERIRLNTGELSFVNLNNGRIDGSELLYRYSLEQQQFLLSYTTYEGKADNGDYLADIPTNEFSLGYVYSSDNWQFDLDWQYRQSKDEIGSGELPNSSYDVLDLSFEYKFDRAWSLSVTIDNALDELYVPSNDDLDTFATGRNLGVSLHWHGN